VVRECFAAFVVASACDTTRSRLAIRSGVLRIALQFFITCARIVSIFPAIGGTLFDDNTDSSSQ
jgi:hypothetical protein